MDLGPYIPYLSPDSNNELMQQRQFNLNEQTEKIKRTFASIVFDLRKDIMDKNNLEDVTALLKFNDKNLYEKMISECSCLEDILEGLSAFFSFFDYDIVKLLARKLGSTAIKKRLVKYRKKLQDFCKRRICEVPIGAFDKVETSENGDGVPEKVYKIKIDQSLTTLCLDDLSKLRYKMNRILGHELLRLLHVEEGCVGLTYRTLKNDDLIITAKQQRGLSKLGVLSISYGDVAVKISNGDGEICGCLLLFVSAL